MPWLRYLGIAFLDWVVTYVITGLVVHFIVPPTWTGYALSLVVWLIAFGVTFAFAEWAFRSRLPGKREMGVMLGIWMVVTVSLFILFFWYFLGTIGPFIYSVDSYVQLLLDIVAILLAGYLIRRRKIKEAFGEGLTE
ncbi:MAG: hypothetical protein WA001_03600 [Patescibacteria group bacterium]